MGYERDIENKGKEEKSQVKGIGRGIPPTGPVPGLQDASEPVKMQDVFSAAAPQRILAVAASQLRVERLVRRVVQDLRGQYSLEISRLREWRRIGWAPQVEGLETDL